MKDKKFIETFDVDDWEVLTDTGWEDIVKVHKTIPYTIWEIHTKSFELKCADKHLVFNENMFPTYVDELKVGDKIWTENGLEEVISIDIHDVEDNMYDLELGDDSNHRYYTNGILSHNTLLVKSIAKMLDVPFAVADATTLTEAGYVGDDVENILCSIKRCCF